MTLCDIKAELKKLEDNSPVMVITIAGAIEKTAVEQVGKKFVEVLAQDINKIILVCGKIEYINSTGMGLLMQMYDEVCEQRGGVIKLVAVPKLIATNFKLLNMNTFFEPYYATVEEALHSLMPGRAEPPGVGKVPETPVPAKEAKEKPAILPDTADRTPSIPGKGAKEKIAAPPADAAKPPESIPEKLPKEKTAAPAALAMDVTERLPQSMNPGKKTKEKIAAPSPSPREEPASPPAPARDKEVLLREGIFGLLKSRFGAVSGKLQNDLAQMTSAPDLESLLQTAATSGSLEEFGRELGSKPPNLKNDKRSMSIEIKITY